MKIIFIVVLLKLVCVTSYELGKLEDFLICDTQCGHALDCKNKDFDYCIIESETDSQEIAIFHSGNYSINGTRFTGLRIESIEHINISCGISKEISLELIESDYSGFSDNMDTNNSGDSANNSDRSFIWKNCKVESNNTLSGKLECCEKINGTGLNGTCHNITISGENTESTITTINVSERSMPTKTTTTTTTRVPERSMPTTTTTRTTTTKTRVRERSMPTTTTTTTTTNPPEALLSTTLKTGAVGTLVVILSGLLIIVIIIAIFLYCKLRNKQKEESSNIRIRNAGSNASSLELMNRTNTYTQEPAYCEIMQNINSIETVGNTKQNQDDGPQYGLIINELYAGCVEGEVPNASLYEELSLPKSQISARYRHASQSRNLYVEPPVSLPELESGLRSCPFEIKLRELSIGAQFASGHFGVVYRATYRTGRGDMPVAVKTLRESANPDTMVAFMTEAATLVQFSHPNVLRLMGVVTAQQPWMIVTELLKTELRELLIKLKDFPQNAILPSLLFKFSCEIAAGMQYLSGINFIHRDLAARNVLVAKDMTIRVADFGMSREVVPESDYYTASGGTVPLRWTAPEAVLYKKFSEKSDVWSYGMTLVEIWTLGDKPWGECTNEEIIEALTIGGSPPPPSGCPQELSTVMRECWRSDKADRPTFSELVRQLSGISIPVISPN